MNIQIGGTESLLQQQEMQQAKLFETMRRFAEPKRKKTRISEDDPFSTIFINKQKAAKKKRVNKTASPKRVQIRERTEESQPSVESEESSEKDDIVDGSWRNE